MSKRIYVIAMTFFLIGVTAALMIAIRAYLANTAQQNAQQFATTAPKIGGPFSLIDHTGKVVTDQTYRGRFVLVFFGYTNCPDICPTNLQIISETMDILGKQGDRVQPIFITIDPERDTVDMLSDYVSNFHPRLVGLTGSREAVAEAAKRFRVYHSKFYATPTPGEENTGPEKSEAEENADYLMNHSTLTYLLGPDGQGLSFFGHGTTPEAMAQRISRLIDTNS